MDAQIVGGTPDPESVLVRGITLHSNNDLIAPGGGVPSHQHHCEDEFFYVLEGEMTLTVDADATVVAAVNGPCAGGG